MNELDLPTAPPLTEEVSERALATVRAGMRRPPVRRAPYLAAAAAVIVTLLVSSLVVAGLGRDDRHVATPPPVTPVPQETVDPFPQPDFSAYDGLLARCVTTVTNTGRTFDYPPTKSWKVTGVLLSGSREQAVAINDAFACHADASAVSVTAPRGAPAGDVQIVRLTPIYLAVLNPKGLSFQVDVNGFESAPVLLVRLGRAMEPAADFHLTVVASSGGPAGIQRSWDGPMPEPGAVAVTDGVPPPPATAPDLDACLADNMAKAPRYESWRPVLRHEEPGIPTVAVGRVGVTMAGFCFADPAGPIYADGYLPPIGGQTNPGIVATIHGADSVRIVLAAVPADATGATLTATPDQANTGSPCQIQDGLALCTLRTTDPVTVVVHGTTDAKLPVR